ncbi:MAG: GlsB/YeaQ/YmgE family stress response membrane protein [Chakrabartia sp.]
MMIFGGSGWLMTIVLGGLAGAVGKWLMPGKDPGGLVVTVLLGIAGALLMTFLGQVTGWYKPQQGAGLVAAIIGALLLLMVYRAFSRPA